MGKRLRLEDTRDQVRVSVIVITRFAIVISRFGHRDHEGGEAGPDSSRLQSWSLSKSFLRGVD